jgi:hypothetical protein
MAEEQLVIAYCNGRIFSFERAQTHSPSVFGGPIEAELSGVEHGPKPLHMIACLSSEHLPALGRHHRFCNMPELQPTKLVVAVPPPATLGFSLWGSSAGDDVTILFECDLSDRIVYASNICD